MKKFVLLLAVAGLALAGCSDNMVEPQGEGGLELESQSEEKSWWGRGQVVVANRASGTISVIDARTAQVTGTFELPAESGEPTPEPMYVVHTVRHDRVFVGDRANNRVAVFDDRTFAVEGTVSAGQGVFHMWADARGRQLWVNNDIDNTTTVIDPGSLDIITTVPTPADLVALGGKPHDVILGPWGYLAYVSVLGVAGESDYVVQFNTANFEEIGRAAVGKDPHLSLNLRSKWLYVPCQNSDAVVVLNRFTLEQQTELAVPGAHGAGLTLFGRYFYTTNLPGGGTDALYTIDTRTNSLVGSPVDSPYPVPHNIALTAGGKKLFLAHSGATADKVTVYRMSHGNPVPSYDTEVTVGQNPFGIAYVK